MEEFGYSKLDNVLIDDCELVLKHYSMISNFCKRNNILTLGELLNKYDNNLLIFRNKKSEEEIHGFIDLVKYVYFDKTLSKEFLLLEEIVFSENSWMGEYYNGRSDVEFKNEEFLNPLRRLGFSSNESDSILSYVFKKKQNMLIIDALINYKKDSYKWFPIVYKGSREIIIKKINILIDYYIKKCDDNIFLENSKLIHIKQLLCEYKNIYAQLEVLENKIKNVKLEINLNREFVKAEDFKKLIKDYNIKGIR